MKYTSENIEKLVRKMVCSEGELKVIEVESIVNADAPALSIKKISLGCGYSMLISIEKATNNIHKYDVMYDRVVHSMSNIEKIHAVI